MDVNGQAQNDMHTLAQGRALAEQNEDEAVEEHETEGERAEEHELQSHITEEHELEADSFEQNEVKTERHLNRLVAGSFGIADVLFPASPPSPVNARVIKLFSADDERKPRGLASAAGLFGVRRADPYEWRSPSERSR
jgi:hypothetical protein